MRAVRCIYFACVVSVVVCLFFVFLVWASMVYTAVVIWAGSRCPTSHQPPLVPLRTQAWLRQRAVHIFGLYNCRSKSCVGRYGNLFFSKNGGGAPERPNALRIATGTPERSRALSSGAGDALERLPRFRAEALQSAMRRSAPGGAPGAPKHVAHSGAQATAPKSGHRRFGAGIRSRAVPQTVMERWNCSRARPGCLRLRAAGGSVREMRGRYGRWMA